jgi:hypothetical protein
MFTAADFYRILFDAIISDKNPAHGREGYYCPENGEFPQSTMCKNIAQALFEHGKIESDQPVLWTKEEMVDNVIVSRPVPFVIVCFKLCRTKGERSWFQLPLTG